jgi:hypothetical protein
MRSRQETLLARHRALEADLAREAVRPAPDALRIGALKREKLRLKDELAALERRSRRRRRGERMGEMPTDVPAPVLRGWGAI